MVLSNDDIHELLCDFLESAILSDGNDEKLHLALLRTTDLISDAIRESEFEGYDKGYERGLRSTK